MIPWDQSVIPAKADLSVPINKVIRTEFAKKCGAQDTMGVEREHRLVFGIGHDDPHRKRLVATAEAGACDWRPLLSRPA